MFVIVFTSASFFIIQWAQNDRNNKIQESQKSKKNPKSRSRNRNRKGAEFGGGGIRILQVYGGLETKHMDKITSGNTK